MQLLTTNNVYDVENDRLRPDFLRLVQSPPAKILIHEGNAGLGADWPAAIWTSLNAMGLALAIFSAPSAIKDNWPLWKEIYDSVVEQVVEWHGEFSIDRDSAQVIAMHHAVAELGIEPSDLSVHMAIRHFFTTFAGWEDLLTTERHVMDWSQDGEFGSEAFSQGVRSTEEAARQADCRYVFGISDHKKCVTVAVERDGSVSFVGSFEMNKAWG